MHKTNISKIFGAHSEAGFIICVITLWLPAIVGERIVLHKYVVRIMCSLLKPPITL